MFGCAWFRFRRRCKARQCAACSIQCATCNCPRFVAQPAVAAARVVAKLRCGAATCFHSHFHYDTATSICFVARKQRGGGRGKSSVPQYEATSLTSWGNKKSATTIIKQATAGRADLGRTRGELISLHGRIFRLHMHVGHAACSMGHAACGCLSRVAHKCGSRHD